MTSPFLWRVLALAGALVLPACGGGAADPAAPGVAMPDFLLVDVNPNSATYNGPVSPRDQLTKASGWYFAHATCGTCQVQFTYLDQMQAEILSANPSSKVRLLGVNQVGYETGNAGITAGRTIPWLQDVVAQNVYGSWTPAFRDVVILDALNVKVSVYNLVTNPLSDPGNYAQLKALLLAAAGE